LLLQGGLLLEDALLGDGLSSLFVLVLAVSVGLLGTSLEALLLRTGYVGHVVNCVRLLGRRDNRFREAALFLASLVRVVVEGALGFEITVLIADVASEHTVVKVAELVIDCLH